MSLWLPEQLQIILCPDRVVAQGRPRAAGRGSTQRQTVCFEAAAGGPPWQPAVAALESALPALVDGRARTTVVLSNQFLRYALVPWRAELTGTQENLSYTRHCLDKVYGPPGRPCEVRLSQQAPGLPRLASAVDAELLETLKAVCGRAGIRVQSIQPHLMNAFNGARRQLRRRSAWLALLESGHLCLARLDKGRWMSVRSHRLDGLWHDALVSRLERESFLADDAALPRDVYVGTLGDIDARLPQRADWHFHRLEGARVADAPAQDASLPVAAATLG